MFQPRSRFNTMWIAAFSALAVVHAGMNIVAAPKSRTFEMLNKSGKKLVVEWVNPKTGEMIRLADFDNGEHTRFNSFVNHTFAVHERSETCQASDEGNCEIRFITVSENEEEGKEHCH